MSAVELSVIIPVFNEESVLPHLRERLSTVIEKLNMPCEVIFVNDGSSDGSLALINDFHRSDPRIKGVSFSRNFGHQAAITAGLNFTAGRAVVIIDGDLQDPPEIIPSLLEKWREGFEVVYGVRTKRKENIIKRGFYSLYYRLLKKMARTDIPLDSGDCCLMDRKVVDLLNSMPERNRFVRGLRSWVGFRQTGLFYERDRRHAGKSKYTFFKLAKLGLDGILSFSEIPLKISAVIGFIIAISSMIFSSYILISVVAFHGTPPPGWASIAVGMSFLGGIQLMIMGFLGEYLLRVFDEVKGRPQYILSEMIGYERPNAQSIDHHPGA